jgi:cyclase
MNRRDFLVRSSLLASAGLLARSSLFAQTPAAAPTVPVKTPAGPMAKWIPEFRPLRNGVGLFTGRGGTIGWLSNPDALMVVDTQFPDSAAVCLAGLRERADQTIHDDRTIDVVLNTHHHGDHTGGNGVFKPAARTIVAQANVPGLMRATVRAGTEDKQTYPDATFPDSWLRVFGSETVTAQYFGPAHTRGDVIVHFQKANVVHVGDLVFNRIYPVTDKAGGCSIRGWIDRLETVVKTYPADAIYIFGHGNPKFGVTGGHADMQLQRDFLSALLAQVEKGIAAGKAKSEIIALENFPGFDDLHAPLPNRLQGNLSVAYDELTGKKA